MFFFIFIITIITGTEFLLQKLCFIFIPKISNYLKPLLYNKLCYIPTTTASKKRKTHRTKILQVFQIYTKSISLLPTAFSLLSAPERLILAKIEPEILCHTLKIAPGSVASGFPAKFAAASDTASPLFCIPTSIAIAVVLEYST